MLMELFKPAWELNEKRHYRLNKIRQILYSYHENLVILFQFLQYY